MSSDTPDLDKKDNLDDLENDDTSTVADTTPTDAESSPVTDSTDTVAEARSEAVAPRGRTKWILRTGAALLALCLIAAIVYAVIVTMRLQDSREADAAAAEALSTAQAYAVTLTSIDANDIDANFQAVLDGATGEFKDTYEQSSAQLRQVLLDNQANGQGTVVAAGVKSATPTQVEVLLFVDQTVSNTSSPDPRLDRSRIVMTMDMVDGRWLASKVDLP